MIVYQFSGINEWLSQNIYNKVIYLNSPANFNDPTENNFTLKRLEDCVGGEAAKKGLIKSVYKSLNNKFSEKNIENTLDNIDKNSVDFEKAIEDYTDILYKKLEGRSVESFCHEVVRKAQLEFKIASLTKNKDNPLMWGHYADGMRGVCIAYDLKSEDLNEVLYKECYDVNIMEVMADGGEEEVKKTFLRKSPNWSYENEYRIIRVGESFYNLEGHQLKKVFFGYECDPEKADFIKNMALSSFGGNVRFYVTRNSFSSYLMKSYEVDGSKIKEEIIKARESFNDVDTFFKDTIHDKIFANEIKSFDKGSG